MTFIRAFGLRILSVLALLLPCAPTATAMDWQDDRYHLSMDVPTGWVSMSKALLAQTNANVSHVTGRGFIAGFALYETDTLLFPYMLVQFKPYDTLPKQYRLNAKPDERDKLDLLYALVGAFRQRGPLPETIDTPQFIDQFGNDHARLVRLEDDGRFDFTGKIPHEIGNKPIRYHTHGLIGKDGIAIVSVFTIDDYAGLSYVIQNNMRTLALEAGYGIDGLPDEPPAPEPVAGQPTDSIPQSAQSPAVAEPLPVDAGDKEVETNAPAARETTNPADSKALLMILLLLGTVLLGVLLIAWYVTHKKAQARRERSRARRERLQASQSTAQVGHPPRPADPSKARVPGNSGRQRHGTTRS